MKENVTPIAALPQESVAGVVKESASVGSPTRKSLIPVRTPPKGAANSIKTERKPLTPIQNSKIKMVGRQSSSTVVASSPPAKKLGRPGPSTTTTATVKTNTTPTKRSTSPLAKNTAPSFSSTPLSSPITTTKSNQPGVVINKATFVDKEVQTDHPDLALVTGDEPPPSYWKDLAETRREALEEALTENEELHKRIEELEKDNETLEEMVERAREMAEMVSSLIPGDSGIGADESVRSTDNSELATPTADDEDEVKD